MVGLYDMVVYKSPYSSSPQTFYPTKYRNLHFNARLTRLHVHVHVRCRKLTVVSLIMASFARLVLNSCWNAATIESYAIDSTLNLLLASIVVNNDCC